MDVKSSASTNSFPGPSDWYPGAAGYWVFGVQWYPNGPPPPPMNLLKALNIKMPIETSTVKLAPGAPSRKNSSASEWESVNDSNRAPLDTDEESLY